MAYTIIATIKVKKEGLEKAAKILSDHAEWIKENEPGTIYYFVHRVKRENTLVVYERYKDKDAFKIHGQNLAKEASGFMKYLDGNIEITKLEDV